jgi:hypothetical protein
VPNFNRAMPHAPRDGREMLLLVCTGEEETPITREVGWWDRELKRWEGDWRYYNGEGGYPQAEPIGWATLPEIDQSFVDALKARAKVPALKGPDPKGAAPDEFDAIGAKLARAPAERATGKTDKRAAARAEKRATTKVDPRPATSKPSAGGKPKPGGGAARKSDTFDAL